MIAKMRYGVLWLVLTAWITAPGTSWSACFQRGDVDGDGSRNITDAIGILDHLFGGGAAISCRDAADVDDDGRLTITDGVYLLQHLFRVRPFSRPLPDPYQYCAPDPTEDALGCEEHSSCGTVYGIEVDAEALVFVLDRSGSMQVTGELIIAKAAMACAINELDPEKQFGIVIYDKQVLRFPAAGPPVTASEDMKKAASAWLHPIPGDDIGSCIQEALLAGLTLANGATGERRTIVYIGDGYPGCANQGALDHLKKTLAAVAAANLNDVVIHALDVLNIPWHQWAFLEDLAAQNGGEFLRVIR